MDTDNKFSGSRLMLWIVIIMACLVAWKVFTKLTKHATADLQKPAIVDLQKPATIDLHLVDGRIVNTKEFHGNVLVVNIWSTRCGPCIKEMPLLAQSYRRYHSSGLEMVAVAVSANDLKDVIRVRNQHYLPFKVAYDVNNEAVRTWGQIRYTPTTFVIDREGNVVKTIVGMISPREFNLLIESLL